METSNPTRREILIVIRRLASLGMLEAARPALMRDSQFAELLAQEPGSLPSGELGVSTPQTVASLATVVQGYVNDIAQGQQQLSDMVLGVGAGVSGSGPGFKFSVSGSFAISLDLDSKTAQWGLFRSAQFSETVGQPLATQDGATVFVGHGSLSGLEGSSNSVAVGPVSVSANQQLETVGYTFGPAVGASISTNPANSTVRIAGGSADLTAPFVGFYSWLNGVFEEGWAPYAPPDPFPYDPGE